MHAEGERISTELETCYEELMANLFANIARGEAEIKQSEERWQIEHRQ